MSYVLLETRGPVRVIRFARSEKRNALNLEMYRDWAQALQSAELDPTVHVTLLLGSGGSFCAGNDLADFAHTPPREALEPVEAVLHLLSEFSKPLLAAVDGPAVGIGTTLLLHCDLVLASTRARFQLPFCKLGLVPEAGSSLLLPLTVGLKRASEWLFFGEAIEAHAAQQAGLVSRVVEPEALENAAYALAEELATRPLEALRLTKQLLRKPWKEALKSAMDSEASLFVERLRSPEAIQAFAGFLRPKPRP